MTRIYERQLYFLGFCLGIAYGVQQAEVCLALAVIILANFCVGFPIEGVRRTQACFMVGFIFLVVMTLNKRFDGLFLGLYAASLLIPVFLNILYGEGNFSKYKITGPFEVGYKDFMTREDGLEASCYYPMDTREYN